MSDSDEKPDWWTANEELRDEMDLPPYYPPKFADGTYTHDIVPDLERELDVTIQFMGFNSRYPDDFVVVVDETRLFEIGRHRDGNGNTIYGLTAEAFEQKLQVELEQL